MTTAPGSCSIGYAHRTSCTRTRCSTNDSWLRASSTSVRQNRSNPLRMNSSGVQANASTSRASRVMHVHGEGALATGRRSRREQVDSLEPPRIIHPQRPPLRLCLGVRREPGVSPVDVEQILTLDVEDERLGVRGLGPQHAAALLGLEQHVKQEEGVGGLGRDPRDSRDRDVAALLPVHEGEVGKHGLSRLIDADAERQLHLVEEERLLAMLARRLLHPTPRGRGRATAREPSAAPAPRPGARSPRASSVRGRCERCRTRSRRPRSSSFPRPRCRSGSPAARREASAWSPPDRRAGPPPPRRAPPRSVGWTLPPTRRRGRRERS